MMSTTIQHESLNVDARYLKKLRAQFRRVFGRSNRQSQYNTTKIERDIGSKQSEAPEVHVAELICSHPSIASTPAFQQALVVARKGEYELRHNHEVPELENEDEVRIRSYAVGLNPIDWKSVSYNFCLPDFPWITGREMSGVVEAVGKNVTHVQPGDRVWTSTYYRDVRAGCFQEYIVVPQHTVLPIPTNLSFEEASCLGVAALTASMTLWKWLSMPIPVLKSDRTSSMIHTQSFSNDSGYHTPSVLSSSPSESRHFSDAEEWILIWGGSTITGQFATQLAKLSGFRPITVCSERTASLSKSLGADHVVIRDNRAPSEIVDEIQCITQGRITRALDLVGPKTASLCLQVCSSPQQLEFSGERKVIFAPLAMMSNSEEIPSNIIVETVEMKRFVLDVDAGLYGQKLNELIESGSIRLPALDVLDGGLAAVESGLEKVKKGDMGGRKVIVKIYPY